MLHHYEVATEHNVVLDSSVVGKQEILGAPAKNRHALSIKHVHLLLNLHAVAVQRKRQYTIQRGLDASETEIIA